jgi:hypothetical protein
MYQVVGAGAAVRLEVIGSFGSAVCIGACETIGVVVGDMNTPVLMIRAPAINKASTTPKAVRVMTKRKGSLFDRRPEFLTAPHS